MQETCKKGHEYTPENTGTQTTGRYCKTCKSEYQRRSRAKDPSYKQRTKEYNQNRRQDEAYREKEREYARFRREDPSYRKWHSDYMSVWRSNNPDVRSTHRHRRREHVGNSVPQRWKKSECPDNLCYWCGVDLTTVPVDLDHIMPISLGGEAKPYNEVFTCSTCNRRKYNKHPLVWIASLCIKKAED